MGLCYQALGRPIDAVAAFQTTTVLDTRSVEAYNNLGMGLRPVPFSVPGKCRGTGQ